MHFSPTKSAEAQGLQAKAHTLKSDGWMLARIAIPLSCLNEMLSNKNMNLGWKARNASEFLLYDILVTCAFLWKTQVL